MAMRKVTRTQLEEEDDDMVRDIVLMTQKSAEQRCR